MPGSFIRWHGDNEPLFGPQNSPKVMVSLSLGNSVEFMVRRRARRVMFPLRFGWTMVTFWSWMVWPTRSMSIARRLGCRSSGQRYLPLGCTTHCVSSCRRSGLCAPYVCARFSRAKLPLVGRRGTKMVLFLGIGPLFVNSGVCPCGQHLDSH